MMKRVLLADTDRSDLLMIKDLLTKLEIQVEIAGDGKKALDKVEMQLFDLYIINVQLPVIDGLELMAKIREIQPLAVIVLITDNAHIDQASAALNKGAFHYLTKPIEVEEFAKALNSGLKQSEDLEEVGSISPASLEISRELIDLLLLKGFTSEQQNEFQQLGTLRTYQCDEKISLGDNLGTMIWVESGRISVMYNSNQVDVLRPGDLWGEETFIGTNSIFTELVSLADSQVRHFSRKKLLDFFTYNDESLIKRFMINLIQCMYFKWRKAVIKIGTPSNYNSLNKPEN